MRQLLQNLIGNALKFRLKGRPPVIVIAGRDAGGGMAEVSVADNGIGLDPAYAERIFDPFTRLNPRGEYEGSGIGLAICARIVRRHGGSITATGKPGQGATVTILLPAGKKE